MSRTGTLLASTAAAALGGFAIGLLVAPQSGRQARSAIAARARAQTQRFETRLHGIEEQLIHLEEQLLASSHELGERVSGAYIPDLSDDADWAPAQDEVEKDLGRLPGA